MSISNDLQLILNSKKKSAVISFLQMQNFEFDKKTKSIDLMKNFIKENNINISKNKDLQNSYNDFIETNSYRTFLNEINKYVKKYLNIKTQNIKLKDQEEKIPYYSSELNKNNQIIEKLKKDIDIDKETLIYLKSSSNNADSKLGWMITFFALIISAIVAIGIFINKWYIICPVLAFPITSVSILATQIITNHSERFLDKYFLKINESFKNVNIDKEKRILYSGYLEMGECIEKVEDIIIKKELMIAISFAISFPFLFPFILKRYKIKNKY